MTSFHDEAERCRSSAAPVPQSVRQIVAGVALPTAPRRCGSALQELHCPLPPGSEAVCCRSPIRCPLPLGTSKRRRHHSVLHGQSIGLGNSEPTLTYAIGVRYFSTFRTARLTPTARQRIPLADMPSEEWRTSTKPRWKRTPVGLRLVQNTEIW